MSKVPTVDDYNRRYQELLYGHQTDVGDAKQYMYPIPLPKTENETNAYRRMEMIDDITLQDGNAAKMPNRTLFGKKYLNDKDLEFLRINEKKMNEREFLDFFATLYYNADPENRRHYNKLYPGYVNSIIQLLQKKAHLVARWERLKVMVPETTDDMILLFLVNHKNLPPPSTDWWIPKTNAQYKVASDYRSESKITLKQGANTVEKTATGIQPFFYPRKGALKRGEGGYAIFDAYNHLNAVLVGNRNADEHLHKSEAKKQIEQIF